MIAIIGAMDVEVNAILDIMHDVKIYPKLGIDFYTGKIINKDVILTKSGVGKVNATITATTLINLFNIDMIINIGTAGGLLQEQKTLDVVISNNLIQYDFDTSYIDGKDGLGIYSHSDNELMKKVNDAYLSIKKDFEIFTGDILSGDTFIGEKEKILQLIERFPSGIACDMESGAISQVANKFNIPFIVVRSLSDIVYHDNSANDYAKNVAISSNRSAKMLLEFIKMI